MWIEELPSGKFRFCERYDDYLTGKKKRISVTFDTNNAKTRKAAAQILKDKISASQSAKSKDMTLADVYDAFIAHQKKTAALSTQQRYISSKALVCDLLGKDTLVGRMTTAYVEDKFLASGKSATTLNDYLRRLKTVIRWAYQSDLISSKEFVEKLDRFKDTPHRIKIKDKFLDSEELKALINDMKIEEWKLTTQFLVASGLRIGEMTALMAEDIDFENKCIHVTKSFDPANRIVTPAKNFSSCRDVYMQPELENLSRRLLVITKRKLLSYGLRRKKYHFLINDKGEAFNYDSYRQYLHDHSLAALGRVITPHALRHTHASLLFEQGFSMDEVARRLGHSDSRVTRDIYVHITKKLEEQDRQKLAKVSVL